MDRGQQRYEQDVAKRPLYPDGTPRRTWEELPEYAKWSWRRDGTPPPVPGERRL